jgi:hypothetical protein
MIDEETPMIINKSINECATVDFANSNMADHAAMGPKDVSNNVLPRTFEESSDVEEFIIDCKRYFEIFGIKGAIQVNFVKCLMKRELIPVFEEVQTGTFDERLRMAFKKPSSLAKDITKLVEYRKEDSAEVYFKKIETLVDNVMKYKWEKKI